MLRKVLLPAFVGIALATGAHAQVASESDKTSDVKPLTIGDAARPLDISDWIKGDKVTKFERGRVYVLEFWATWCSPCRASMPHLSELQNEFKDYKVTIIGVSDESRDTVTSFLDKKDKDGNLWSSKVQYVLATDPDKSAKIDYWTAAGQDKFGIPSAFIIGKDSKIEWIGHPMELEKPLREVVHDEWDRTAFKTQWEKEQAELRVAREFEDTFRTAKKQGDFARALELLDARLAKDPNNFDLQFKKFVFLLADMGDAKKGYAYGLELAEANWTKPGILNQLAWTVVDAPDIKKRDLDFAFKLASKAVDLTDSRSGAILDTLARVHFEKNDLQSAVRVQKKAVEFAEEGMEDGMKETLKKYEAALAARN